MHVRRILSAYLCALWLTNAWRAATQSIVHDEALTWQFFLSAPLSTVFELYNANNHFLAVVMMRIATGLFGYSELSMRLVSLAAGALYFYAVLRLCLRAFGERWATLLPIVLMTLNPLVLDFLVAARGYGAALALFTSGLWLTLETLEEKRPDWRRVLAAGIMIGASFAANLIFTPPALALTASFWWLARGRGAWIKLLPAGVASMGFLLFVFSPIAKATGGDFYVGTMSLLESADDLARCSLAHNAGWANLNLDTAAHVWFRRTLAFGLAPVVLALGIWLGLKCRTTLERLTFILTVILGATAAVLQLLHLATGFPLPIDRTGLYFLPLGGLMLASVAMILIERGGLLFRLHGTVLAGFGALICAQYALQFQTTSFYTWRYDADTRALLEKAQAMVKPPASAVVSWQFEPAANFYRTTRNWHWLKPVTREHSGLPGDFYLLLPNEGPMARQPGLEIVMRGPVSGAYLCVRR